MSAPRDRPRALSRAGEFPSLVDSLAHHKEARPVSLLAPARAADFAEDDARACQLEHDANVAHFGPSVAAFVDTLTNEGSFSEDPRKLLPVGTPPAMLNILLSGAQSMANIRWWRSNRIVYTVDSHLLDEIQNTDPEYVVPAGLVRMLPHPNPYIALPDPVDLPIPRPASESETTRYCGAFVTAVSALRAPCRTDDPDAVALNLTLAGRVLGANGRWKRSSYGEGCLDAAWARISLNAEAQPLGQIIEEATARFRRGTGNTPGVSDSATIVETLISRIVPLLIYLCAENAERRTTPTVATKRRADGGTRPGKPPRVIEHGYWLGPALLAARREYERHEAVQPTGVKRRSHIRRAHPHTYWTGPGRTVPVIRWLAPIPVNQTSEDATKPTVVPVAQNH